MPQQPAATRRRLARVLQGAVLTVCALLLLMQARSIGLHTHSGAPQHMYTHWQLCDGGRLHALLDGAARWAAVTWLMPDTHVRIPTQRPQLQHSSEGGNNSSSSPLNFAARLAAAVEQQQEPLTPTTVVAAIDLASRLVVGIACAVHSGLAANASASAVSLPSLPLMRTLIPSFLRSAEPSYSYKFFLAHDQDDALFSRADVRGNIDAAFASALAAEDARRWHLHDYAPGTIDPSTLVASVHWVACPYSGKPAWAQNDAAMAAFAHGRADYILRINDDTHLPGGRWASSFIADLRGRQPVPNLGVVGPACKDGNTAILTHDMVHAHTHISIHGCYYPRAFPTWWADDWMTRVYAEYTRPRPLLVVRHDLPVVHRLVTQRYKVDAPPNITLVLSGEVRSGRAAVERYALRTYGVELHT